MSKLENMDIKAMENLINKLQNNSTVDKEQLLSLCENMKMYIQNLEQERNNLQQENIDLQMQIRNFKKLIFGTKREYTPQVEIVDNIQCSLFETEEQMDKQIDKQIKEETEKLVVKTHTRRKRKAGISKDKLQDIEIEENEYILNEEQCPECKSQLKMVSKNLVRTEIQYIPAKLKVSHYVQATYKCCKCGNEESEKETSTFVKASVPNPLLTHSFVSPSLATEVIYQKYKLGVPLYRQERMWEERGLILPRNMMANWVIKICEYYLQSLYELIDIKMSETNKLIHIDETTMQCNKEEGRAANSKSYLWAKVSGEHEDVQAVVFKYSPSRAQDIAKEFVKGFKGTIVTDGYAGYNDIADVVHAQCWAHCRRYFHEALPLDKDNKIVSNSESYKGLQYCNKLFKIEEEIADFDMPKKLEERNIRSKPIVEEFFKWVNNILETRIAMSSKLKKALTYAQNQKEELTEFLKDGNIPLSNNRVERAIRPIAVHRKNWLFADTVEGANANAIIYSIVETAKANNLNVYKYINYLLEQLPQLENIYDTSQLEKYLPWSQQLPEKLLNCQSTDKQLENLKELKATTTCVNLV